MLYITSNTLIEEDQIMNLGHDHAPESFKYNLPYIITVKGKLHIHSLQGFAIYARICFMNKYKKCVHIKIAIRVAKFSKSNC